MFSTTTARLRRQFRGRYHTRNGARTRKRLRVKAVQERLLLDTDLTG